MQHCLERFGSNRDACYQLLSAAGIAGGTVAPQASSSSRWVVCQFRALAN